LDWRNSTRSLFEACSVVWSLFDLAEDLLPGGGQDATFDEFCSAYAAAVGAKSSDAVKQQIRFALPESEHGSTWERQAQTAILNKAAALEAGFIEDKHLPNLLAVGRSEKTQV
jgi:hypothetical protein